MNLSIHSSELNDMMRTVGRCINQDVPAQANVELIHRDNLLTIRATNGTFYAEASAPAMGGDGESICLDGKMFSDVAGKARGEIYIESTGNVCTIKGLGRIKLPVVKGNVPEPEEVTGQSISVDGYAFTACYRHVKHAVATDESRIILTGVLVETDNGTLRMTALDGFQLSMEETVCTELNGPVKMVVPGKFLDLVDKSLCIGNITVTTDGKAVSVRGENLLLRCGLLQGEYIAYEKMLPAEFSTQCMVRKDQLTEILKTGRIVGNKKNLVKMDIDEDVITVSSNSEKAEFEAQTDCQMQGEPLRIAFNEAYLSNALGAIDTEKCVICCKSAVSPAIIKDEKMRGVRLVLPVRVM